MNAFQVQITFGILIVEKKLSLCIKNFTSKYEYLKNYNSKIKTNYFGVHPPTSSFAPRPKLGLWWSK